MARFKLQYSGQKTGKTWSLYISHNDGEKYERRDFKHVKIEVSSHTVCDPKMSGKGCCWIECYGEMLVINDDEVVIK